MGSLTPETYDVEAVRRRFPGLHQGHVSFNNAAGTVVLGDAIDAQVVLRLKRGFITSKLSSLNPELGLSDEMSARGSKEWAAGQKERAEFMNASPDEIAYGSSTTQLFRNLSLALLPTLSPDSEMIVSGLCHEAGISAWVALARSLRITIKWWFPSQSANPRLSVETLKPLLSPKTRLVTMGHISNALGTIHPVRAIADLVHTIPGAMLSVDGVAFAPHRPIDVKALDVDIYCFSWYKVFGPHFAQMYVKRSVQDRELTSLGHYFSDKHFLETKLTLGSATYELEHSLTPIVRYLRATGWDQIIAHETKLQEVLLSYLRSRLDIFTIYGEPSSDPQLRVSLVTFRVNGRSSQVVSDYVMNNSPFRIVWGNCWAPRLTYDLLGLGSDGLIRVSFVHYNTMEEVQSFVEFLDEAVCNKMVEGDRAGANMVKSNGFIFGKNRIPRELVVTN